MPVAPNIGANITRFNTGHDVSVSNSAIGAHTAVTTTDAGSGTYFTSHSGQTITEIKFDGVIRVNHPNVTIVSNDIWGIDIANGITGTKIYFNDIGLIGGMRYNGGFGLTAVKGGDYTSVRNRIYGWIDLTRPRWGHTKHVEDWFGPPFSDPEGHKWPPDTPRRRAHCDPSQPHPPPGGSTFQSVLYEGCKFEIFPFDLGEEWLDRINDYSEFLAATAGMINTEFGECSNGTIRSCYFKGNAHQIMYIINGDNNTPAPKAPPQNWTVIDNQFDDGGNPDGLGHSHFMNFGKHSSQNTEPTVTWGRNVLVSTGQTLAAFYTKPYRFGTDHSWGKTKNAGPSDQYPTFYDQQPDPGDPGSGGGGTNPTIQLKVNTPAPNTTHTSGPVTFVGEADSAAGDSNSYYTFFDYYIAFPDEVQSDGRLGTGRIFLDHDQATNNTGFTFNTITNDGVTFTRRNGTAPETHKGRAELIIVGVRTDGTLPEHTIEVTFGDVTPPPAPTEIGFRMDITATLEATPKLLTSVGGIPKSQVKQVLKRVPTSFKWVSVTIWDEALGGTGEEVVPLDANNFKRRYE